MQNLVPRHASFALLNVLERVLRRYYSEVAFTGPEFPPFPSLGKTLGPENS